MKTTNKLLATLLLLSCSLVSMKAEAKSLEEVQLQLMNKLALAVRNKNNLCCTRAKRSPQFEPDTFSFFFGATQYLTIETGRLLSLQINEDLVALANSSKKLKKYFKNRTFTEKNIKIFLQADPLPNPKNNQQIDHIFSGEGGIEYYIVEAGRDEFVDTLVFKEKFEEAIAIADQRNCAKLVK